MFVRVCVGVWTRVCVCVCVFGCVHVLSVNSHTCICDCSSLLGTCECWHMRTYNDMDMNLFFTHHTVKRNHVQQPKPSFLHKGVGGGERTSVPHAAAGVSVGCVCG